jgi:hypothetical protein
MDQHEIAQRRLHNQHIAGTLFSQASDVVRWLGAVQAQDYTGAKWAVGQRAGLTDAQVEAAVNDGAILRTHVLRPTWHFVAPEDIRWMLKLTAPRIKTAMGHAYRQLELDQALLTRTNDLISKALEGGKHLTRKELAPILDAAGIDTSHLLRFNFMLGNAELDGVVCNGAHRGTHPTYALLDERVPSTRQLSRDEALTELALRYFRSHAPATLKDYIWWSGLTAADARAGLEMIKSKLACEMVDGVEYWLPPSVPPARTAAPTAHLLPDFDEYIVAYTDRRAIYDPAHDGKLDARGNVLFNHTLMIDGQVAGIWKRIVKKQAITLDLTFFRSLTDAEQDALTAAVRRYEAFVGLPVVLQ